MKFSRRWNYWTRRFLRLIMQRNDSPRQIAGGVAIGTFWSCNPTIVSQMAFAAITATVFRCSRIPAIAMAYFTNPVTAAPIYGGGYLIGAWIVHLFGFKTPTYTEVMKAIGRLETGEGFWHALREKSLELAQIGWRGLLPMEIGATIMGILMAIPMYWIALRLVTGHRLLKAQKAAQRAKQRLERVRARQESERSATDATLDSEETHR